MKTGTDVSILECRANGYPVVEHDTAKMDPNKEYHLTISYDWQDGVEPKKGAKYMFDGLISYRELWEIFNREGQGIKDYCDFENCPLPENSDSFLDFVTLAGIINTWCGLY